MHTFFNLACSIYASITPVLVVNQPPTVNAQENATIVCIASAVTRNTSLAWMVDGALYNSTSVYNSPRGQVMVELSTFDNNSCRLSLSLTVLNAQSNSQGVYTCVLQYNNFTISESTSLMYVEDSTTGWLHSKYSTVLCNRIPHIGKLSCLDYHVVGIF